MPAWGWADGPYGVCGPGHIPERARYTCVPSPIRSDHDALQNNQDICKRGPPIGHALARAILTPHQAYRQPYERLSSLDEAPCLKSANTMPSAREERRDFFHYNDNYIDAGDRTTAHGADALRDHRTLISYAIHALGARAIAVDFHRHRGAARTPLCAAPGRDALGLQRVDRPSAVHIQTPRCQRNSILPRLDRSARHITRHPSATRLQCARFGGACPRWNVHQVFQTPARFLRQLAETPDGRGGLTPRCATARSV